MGTFYADSFHSGVALLIASLICFGAGAGFRGSLYSNHVNKWAYVGSATLIAGVLLLASHLWLDSFAELVFGRDFNTWGWIGLVIGVLCTGRKESAYID